jgi:hypothetical protein
MTKRSVLSFAALLSISAFACASDPNKAADDAHDAELKSQRKQEQSQAENRSDGRVQAAEADRKATQASTPAATRDVTTADAKLTEARTVYRAKANARLDKADARINELKALVSKAGAKATTSSRDSLTTVDTQDAMVRRSLEQLPTVSNDDWQRAKDGIDSQLGTLEGLVKKAGDEVDHIKK